MPLRRPCADQHPHPEATRAQCGNCATYCEKADYRAAWDQAEAEYTGSRPPVCPQLWKRVRGEGRVVQKRQCGTCPGSPLLDVFYCRHPARRKPSGLHDEVTLTDCQTCPYRPKAMPDARKITLKNHLSPGDVLAMTAAVHSLHKSHPGRFSVAVNTTAQELWEHNPDVVPAGPDYEEVQTHYPGINSCNQHASHFISAYCDFLAENLQVKVPLLTNRPHLYLSEEEKSWMNQVQEVTGRATKFWLVCAGRKSDYTAKFWGSENYQKVVDLLRGRVQFVQVGAAEHYHPPLKGVINLVGKTDLRQLVRLTWHAEGVLCGVTLLHHMAAALEKPCVTLLGGREPVNWNDYPKCQLLHTIGALPCCKDGGCWRSRVVKLDDNAEQNGSLCDFPVGEEPIPRCMSLISPDAVANAILLYYNGGVLSF